MSDTAEEGFDGERTRRRFLKSASRAACAFVAGTLAGCAEGEQKPWQRPDWFRGKRGSNGNGGDR